MNIWWAGRGGLERSARQMEFTPKGIVFFFFKKSTRLQMLASFKCHSLHRGTSNPPLGTRPVQAVVFMTVALEEGSSPPPPPFVKKIYYLKLAGKIAEV